MSNWNLSAQEAAAAVDGRLELIGGGGLADTSFHGIGTDTRANLEGLLFIALVGDVHDAHKYLQAAVEKGAGGLLIHRDLTDDERSACERKVQSSGMPVAVIKVRDTLLALQSLGKHWRHKCRAQVLGITGTNGKTSTKEFLAALLSTRMRVQWSKGSFNNHWGVPLSLLAIDPEHDVAVIEMGMNHVGELKTLSRLVDADAVVCTMVGRGHLEGVGSIDGVAQAKSEIYEFAPPTATFVFNLSNEYTAKMMAQFADEKRRTVTFAEASAAGESAMTGDVSFRVVGSTDQAITVEGLIKGVAGRAVVPVFGRHNVTNLMAASALALIAGLSPAEIWAALPLCRSAWGRNQWVHLKSGARCLFDGYNANPESMKASVLNAAALAAVNKGRKFAVLGEMLELGEQSGALHEELGQNVAKAGFTEVYFFGSSFEAFRRGFLAADTKGTRLTVLANHNSTVAQGFRSTLKADDFVLVKGSRGMGLENFLLELEPLDFKKAK